MEMEMSRRLCSESVDAQVIDMEQVLSDIYRTFPLAQLCQKNAQMLPRKLSNRAYAWPRPWSALAWSWRAELTPTPAVRQRPPVITRGLQMAWS